MNTDYRTLNEVDASEFTLEDYWLAVYSRKWIVILVVCSAMICTGIISSFLPSRFEASTMFYIPDDVNAPVDLSGKDVSKARLPSGNQDNVKAYSGIMKGDLAKKTINARYPDKPERELSRDVDIAVTREGFVKIFVRDKNPVTAATVANAYVDYFNDFCRLITDQDTQRQLKGYEIELTLINKKLLDNIAAKQRLQEINEISSLKTELEELERNRIKLVADFSMKSADLTASHPEILALTRTIKQTENRIRKIPGILTEYDRYEENIRKAMEIKSGIERDLQNMKTGISRLKKAGIVVSPAVPPTKPIFPILWLNVIVAGIFGLLVAIIYAFFIEYLESRSIIKKIILAKSEKWPSEILSR